MVIKRRACAGATVVPVYDAIVLAGGGARRLGGVAKPQLMIGASSLLDHVVAAAHDADQVIVVGPHQPVTQPVSQPLTWCREDPPGGGPVAAIAAAAPLTGADVVLVLAADLPWIAPAVSLLVDAVPPDGMAALVDADGRRNHLAAAWRRAALVAALAGLGDVRGASMRSLAGTLACVLVPDVSGWGRDCNTWPAVAAARAVAEEV